MSAVIIVWSKPACQQCRMVKFRLEAAGVPFEEKDITAPEHAKDLTWFTGLGYRSAPITEFGELVVAGFVPSEIDQIIAAWRAAEAGDPVPTARERYEGRARSCVEDGGAS